MHIIYKMPEVIINYDDPKCKFPLCPKVLLCFTHIEAPNCSSLLSTPLRNAIIHQPRCGLGVSSDSGLGVSSDSDSDGSVARHRVLRCGYRPRPGAGVGGQLPFSPSAARQLVAFTAGLPADKVAY